MGILHYSLMICSFLLCWCSECESQFLNFSTPSIEGEQFTGCEDVSLSLPICTHDFAVMASLLSQQDTRDFTYTVTVQETNTTSLLSDTPTQIFAGKAHTKYTLTLCMKYTCPLATQPIEQVGSMRVKIVEKKTQSQ